MCFDSVSCFSLGGIAFFLFLFFDIVFGTKFDFIVILVLLFLLLAFD